MFSVKTNNLGAYLLPLSGYDTYVYVLTYLHLLNVQKLPMSRIATTYKKQTVKHEQNLRQITQGHRSWCQSKAHKQFPISHNSNFVRISYRFRDIDALCSKIACFPTSPLFDAS